MTFQKLHAKQIADFNYDNNISDGLALMIYQSNALLQLECVQTQLNNMNM